MWSTEVSRVPLRSAWGAEATRVPSFCATPAVWRRAGAISAAPCPLRLPRMDMTAGLVSTLRRGAGAVLGAVGAVLASGGRRTARELADSDSLFTEIDGVLVHYKVAASPARRPRETFAFTHGFGANLYSFEDSVAALIASRPACQTVAFDSPGFGLTSRPPLWRLDQYRPKFGADILAAILPYSERRPVLVGFSMGARAVAQYTLSASIDGAGPRRPRALVLIAPALLPPRQPRRKPGPVRSALLRVWLFLSVVVLECVKYGVVLLSLLFNPVLQLALRLSISGVGFWIQGLKLARGDPTTLTQRSVDNYRKPLAVRQWAVGILHFTRSMILQRQSEVVNLTEGLREMCRDVPILIVHGNLDRIIPLSNSQALSRDLPNATLVIMDGLGHVPHEEDPVGFANVVNSWLPATEVAELNRI